MIGVRAVLAATLACVLAACSTGAAPSPTPVGLPADASSVVITPPAATLTEAATPPSPSPSQTPRPTTTAAPVQPPPEPTGVTFTTEPVELAGPTGSDTITYTVKHTIRWKAPRTQDVEIRAYGIIECLAAPDDPAPGAVGKCLVEATRLPASARVLAATASSAEGEISWIAPFSNECSGRPVGIDGRDYYSIVIAAYDSAGQSSFAIAYPGDWIRPAPGDNVCSDLIV
jgi:hypothetical protein